MGLIVTTTSKCSADGQTAWTSSARSMEKHPMMHHPALMCIYACKDARMFKTARWTHMILKIPRFGANHCDGDTLTDVSFADTLICDIVVIEHNCNYLVLK